MGHLPHKKLNSTSSFIPINQLLNFVGNHSVDVAEWSFEPKKTSKSYQENASIGPITFRTWDFIGLQVSI